MSDDVKPVAGDHFHVCKDCGQVEPMYLFSRTTSAIKVDGIGEGYVEPNQDEKDGVALRRLREAAAEFVKDTDEAVEVNVEWVSVDGWYAEVYTYLGANMLERAVGGPCATIAEAADKCREALK